MARSEAAQRLLDRYDTSGRGRFARDYAEALASAQTDEDRRDIYEAARDVTTDPAELDMVMRLAVEGPAPAVETFMVGDPVTGGTLTVDVLAERDEKFRLVLDKFQAAGTGAEKMEIVNTAAQHGPWDGNELEVVHSLMLAVPDDGTAIRASDYIPTNEEAAAQVANEWNAAEATTERAPSTDLKGFGGLFAEAVAEAEKAETP